MDRGTGRDMDRGASRGEVRVGLLGFCSTSDHTQVRESPSAAQGTHYSDGIET